MRNGYKSPGFACGHQRRDAFLVDFSVGNGTWISQLAHRLLNSSAEEERRRPGRGKASLAEKRRARRELQALGMLGGNPSRLAS